MKKLIEIIENIEKNKHEVEFLPTGFKELDDFLDGGFIRKELVVIGGHTGIGKSSFGGQILYNIARNGFNTAYFSLEMSNEMIVCRLIGALSKISPIRIYSGITDPVQIDNKSRAKGEITAYNDFMDFYDDLYLFDELKKEIVENRYEFIVIDFIQNIMIPGMEEYSRLSHISVELQKIAKEANCCILVLSQLSNRVAKDGSAVVEYKGSGSIATVCDLGFFIERGEIVYGVNEVRLNLKKNRRGISGKAFAFEFSQEGGLLKEKL